MLPLFGVKPDRASPLERLGTDVLIPQRLQGVSFGIHRGSI